MSVTQTGADNQPASTSLGHNVFQFGRFSFSPDKRVLVRDGLSIPLGSRAMDLLAFLVRRPGEVIGKDRLLAEVWGSYAVEPNNLTVQMSTLRRVLGHDETGLVFIQTLPRRGYLFAAPVSRSGEKPAPAPPPVPAMTAGTTFVGRRSELDALATMLRNHSLVVVVGVGGVGKTRLVQQLVAEQTSAAANASWDPVWDEVLQGDLAPIVDPTHLADAIATALSLGSGLPTAEAAIIALLRTRRVLLILDNAEQLVEAAGQLLRRLLEECPRTTILVTSRVSLGIPGEAVFRLSPLRVPDSAEALTAQSALQFEAVRLFMDRAAALVPDFRLDDQAAPVVGEICKRLDGLALAIEMAVPRLQVLAPRQILERLHQRFQLLSAQRLGPRQRTLRAIFDWSWDTLQPAEQRLLQYIAIFTASASLPALVEFGALDRLSEWEALDGLTRLVELSLVVAQPGGPEPRYRLLESVRFYALERLAPGEEAMLRGRHAAVITTIFERSETEWPTAYGATWLARYSPELDNLRAALDWVFGLDPATNASRDVELGLRLTAATYTFWWDLPNLPLREARTWFDLAVERIGPETPPHVQARLWLGHSWRDVQVSDTMNYPSAERATKLFRQQGDEIRGAAAMWRAASAMLVPAHLATATAILDEAERTLRRHGPTKWLGLTLMRRAGLLARHDQLPNALQIYEEALAMIRAVDHQFGLMLCGGNMAEVMFRMGQHDAAREQLMELRNRLPIGLRTPLVAILSTQLAAVGRVAEARGAVWEVIGDWPKTGLRAPLARSLETLAMLTAEEGDAPNAARLAGFVFMVHPQGGVRSGGRLAVFERLGAALDRALPADEQARLMAVGASWAEIEAITAAAALY